MINTARAHASRTVALIDSTKFGRASLLTIAAIQDIHAIITDDGLDAGVRAEYTAGGATIEIASD